jgi:hypothetical protein
MAAQIDAGINFFLWLTGRKYNADSFGRAYSQRCPPSRKAAPLSEMYAYVRKEREEQRLLHLAEYAPCFRSWVCRYLQEDPAAVLSRRDSLAGAAVRKISRKISIVLQRESKKNSTAANSNKSLVSGPPKNRGLKGRHWKAQRADRAPTSADNKYQREADEVTPMTIWANSDKDAGDDQAFQSAPGHRPSIDEVDIPLPIDSRYEDYNDGGASSETENESDGDQDTRAPTPAYDKYQQEADEVTPITIWANSDKGAGDDQAFQSAPVHRPSIDEVKIPVLIDGQYEDYNDGGAFPEAESEADGDQASGPVLFHGKKVVVTCTWVWIC